ncbi:MAG: prolyl oligopeptidase family serine peptidase [Bacteroidaceae bacterium]|nr:prolyl oligopeptidase family serine peptidase [Bacteroidaceae bacterium]
MKQLLIYTILFICFSGKLLAQSFSGSIDYGKTSIEYQIKLTEIDKQVKVFFSSTGMNAYEIPCQFVSLNKDSLQFYVVSDYYTYEYLYIKKNESYRGNLKIYSNEKELLLNAFETNLTRNEIDEKTEIEKTEFKFESNGLQLCGTIWKPVKSVQKGLFFVTSSQGNDRSGTNAEANYFANLGYLVFNYDKRGTGKSEGDWQAATIEELCSDDMNALKFFSKVSSLPLSEIGIKGSSQGGIKIPYILSEIPDLGFGISISCPNGTLLESDLNNWENLNYINIGKENIDKALKLQKAGYDYLAGNISYELLAEKKTKYGNEGWLKFVWIPERDIQKDYKLNFSGLPYFEKITQPILLIQGLSDKVIPLNSFETIENAIEKSKSIDYKVITLKNTSHSMTVLNKEFPYFQILNPEYLRALTEWLQQK